MKILAILILFCSVLIIALSSGCNNQVENESLLGRWLVMEKGDVDTDGDIDLVIGSFILPPGRENMPLINNWVENEIDIIFLENKGSAK